MRVDITELPSPAVVAVINGDPVLLLSDTLPLSVRRCLVRVLKPVEVSGLCLQNPLAETA